MSKLTHRVKDTLRHCLQSAISSASARRCAFAAAKAVVAARSKMIRAPEARANLNHLRDGGHGNGPAFSLTQAVWLIP